MDKSGAQRRVVIEGQREDEMRALFTIAIAAAALALAACNTVRGAGQDLESAADAVDNVT